MRIAGTEALEEFKDRHIASVIGIERWQERVGAASWRSPNEMSRQMTNFDRLGGGVYVFDIHHNRYRIVARIDYANQWVDVRFVGTHAEYTAQMKRRGF